MILTLVYTEVAKNDGYLLSILTSPLSMSTLKNPVHQRATEGQSNPADLP